LPKEFLLAWEIEMVAEVVVTLRFLRHYSSRIF